MIRRSIVLCLALLALLAAGCRTKTLPSLEPSKPPRATLAGRVIGPLDSAPVAGRQVVAVETTSGARYATKTHVSGGFTLFLPPGKYRLDLTLARAERVIEAPEILELEPGAFVRDAEFVLGGAGLVE